MISKAIAIVHFRGIQSLVLDLEWTSVLIGENNAGTTCMPDFLHLCPRRGVTRRAMTFSEYDYHLASWTTTCPCTRVASGEIHIPTPPIDAASMTNVEPVADEQEILQFQNQKLRAVRDLVLPALCPWK